ncbi:AAA family ATPase, partial [Patescibacteria group bacterium]|nr:AAA family ATPase [Patescibacteria group bacterium]
PEIDKLKKSIEELRESNEAFLSQLQRPAPEEDAEKEIDPALEKDLNKLSEQLSEIDTRRKETEERLDEWNKNEEVKRAHIFELQHKLTDVRKDASRTESEANHAEVELARIETRRDGFLQDLRINALALEDNLDSLANEFSEKKLEADPESLAPRLTKLRSQLEWIGGIDPETLKEYEETKQRFEELAVQTEDLKQAMTSLETVIAELDKTIKDRAETSFQLLDREFNNYFKKLFGGGEAKLLEIAPELEVDEDGNEIEQDLDGRAVGIDILATPPGKRLKSVTLLSGGERALISIALICAIMATNPSPFVVLDEVDAALDESNSRKFADIVDGLADRTQFVVVTHNRATMNQAHVLYGVTMGDEGVSKLLSVKLEEVS